MTQGCCEDEAPERPGAGAPRGGTPYRELPIEGSVATLAGKVPQVSTRWRLGDWVGRVLVRLGFRRMFYAVAPGLYAVGRPGPDAPVLVSANYKLSFDVLRRAIDGLDAWILVLDSKGVNVWCAAGKGTFGTAELARRVEATRLAQVVRHHRLVVPQLGAPSVAAHEVERLTDFGVLFGPVRASDIPEFIGRGFQATPGMRCVTFGLPDRLEVAGLELAEAGRAGALLSLLALAATAWTGNGLSWASAWSASAPVLLALWGGVLAGTVLFAALLPWHPGRMFAVKGAALGAAVAAGAWIGGGSLLPEGASPALAIARGSCSARSGSIRRARCRPRCRAEQDDRAAETRVLGRGVGEHRSPDPRYRTMLGGGPVLRGEHGARRREAHETLERQLQGR
jgi:hypothetical protein